MTLPAFWVRPSFSVAESAEIIGVSEAALRTWLARSTADRTGTKTEGRLWLSGADCFFYALVRNLTDIGVGVRVAMQAAEPLVPDDDLPSHAYVIVTRDGGTTGFELADDVPAVEATAVTVVPIRNMARDLIERAGVIHATEAT
jgi:hypothetical protein